MILQKIPIFRCPSTRLPVYATPVANDSCYVMAIGKAPRRLRVKKTIYSPLRTKQSWMRGKKEKCSGIISWSFVLGGVVRIWEKSSWLNLLPVLADCLNSSCTNESW